MIQRRVLATLPHSFFLSLLLLLFRPPPLFLSFFSGVPPTPSRAQPTYRSISLSFSLPFPLPCLSVPLSLYSVHPFRSLPSRSCALSLALACTSAFLSAKRRTGFRRKETTIRRIVATDHSWRVDRINPSELAAATNRIARVHKYHASRAARALRDLSFFFVPSPARLPEW